MNVEWAITEQEALKYLATPNMLARWVDASKLETSSCS
jgi:hypothetical protein